MKKLLLVLAAAIMAYSGNAQSTYSKAIGLRLGYNYLDVVAFSYKGFVSPRGALEFNLGLASRRDWFGLSATGAYQHHFPIGNVPGFNWYIGGGLTLGQTFSDWDRYVGTFAGIFPTGGIDYKFRNIPLNLSADIRPTFYFAKSNAGSVIYPANFGVAVRYTF